MPRHHAPPTRDRPEDQDAPLRPVPGGDRETRAAKPVTPAYLERAATFYLARHAATAAHLAQVLIRKARKRAGPDGELDQACGAWVDEVVAKAVRSGLVDDRSYADTKLNALLRRGSSARTARATLAAKGVPADIAGTAMAEAAPDELAQARRFVERRRLGGWRSRPDPARRERDLASLCRAGFGYRVAVEALDGSSPGHDSGRQPHDPDSGPVGDEP